MADGGVGEVAGGQVIHGHALRLLAGAMSARRDGKGHLVGAGVLVGMGHVLAATCLSVTKVPLVAADGLSRWVGGGGTGELCGIAYANRGIVEVGRRHGMDDHLGRGTVGLAS